VHTCDVESAFVVVQVSFPLRSFEHEEEEPFGLDTVVVLVPSPAVATTTTVPSPWTVVDVLLPSEAEVLEELDSPVWLFTVPVDVLPCASDDVELDIPVSPSWEDEVEFPAPSLEEDDALPSESVVELSVVPVSLLVDV
jgi:hypothetical protein